MRLPGRRVLAQVQSAPIGTLVEQMLNESDNVIAECLARQVALATGQPASFSGAAAATAGVLRKAGLDIGSGLLDGSGLSPNDRISPAALAALLQSAATGPPRLRDVLDGLSVAGWDGTLATRSRWRSRRRGGSRQVRNADRGLGVGRLAPRSRRAAAAVLDRR